MLFRASELIRHGHPTRDSRHPLRPKRDFKLNDVMGGIVITIPLDG